MIGNLIICHLSCFRMGLTLNDHQREMVLTYANSHREALFGTLNNGGVTTGERGKAGEALIEFCRNQDIAYTDFKHFLAQYGQWKTSALKMKAARDRTGANANPPKRWEDLIFLIETAMKNPKFDPTLEASMLSLVLV